MFFVFSTGCYSFLFVHASLFYIITVTVNAFERAELNKTKFMPLLLFASLPPTLSNVFAHSRCHVCVCF